MILSISLFESFTRFASLRLEKNKAKEIDTNAIRICIIECKQNESEKKLDSTKYKYI